MHTVKLFLLCLILSPVARAQEENLDPSISWEYGKTYLKTFDLRNKEAVQEYFLIDSWLPTSFTNEEGNLNKKEYHTKFDIVNNEVNVNIAGKIMVAPKSVVNSFIIHEKNGDRSFMAFKPDNWNKPNTYFEVIVEGDISLLIYHTVKNVGSNYNPAVDAGSREAKMVHRQTYFILTDNKISEIPKKRKPGEKLFAEFDRAKTYFSKNSVKFKRKDDLIELINFLNKK